MTLPTFRFLDAGETPLAVDDEFWRDVEASDRLASPIKANLYLRELCRTKAAEKARSVSGIDEGEQALLHEVYARGYRLFGSDLASLTARRDDQVALRSA